MNSASAQQPSILPGGRLPVFSVVVLAVSFLFTGCASRKAYICARADTRFAPSLTNSIAVIAQDHPKPEDERFRKILVAELERRGVRLVPQASADYTLTFWFDETWQPAKSLVYVVNGAGPYRYGTVHEATPTSAAGYPYWGTAGVQPRMIDDPFPVQGIHLKLYPTARISTNRLQAAWDGYIDTGHRNTTARDARMLKTLLDYFGKEFTGTTSLAE